MHEVAEVTAKEEVHLETAVGTCKKPDLVQSVPGGFVPVLVLLVQ